MSSNKNRFNTSKKTKDWFPFAKYLFITDKHPVRQSEEKCSSSIEALFSQQEILQIEGITNSLQCETREAVRIALSECVKDAEAAYGKTFEKAKAASSVKGHEGRKLSKRLTLPKVEKDAADSAAKTLNITIKEFLRLAVIWLADGIKDESITSLTSSERLGKDAVAREWSRENRDKPASKSVAKLKEAQRDAQALLSYQDELARQKGNRESIDMSGMHPDLRAAIIEEQLQASASNESWDSSLFDEQGDEDDLAFLARCKMRELGVDFETAMLFVKDDLAEDEMFSKMTSKEKLEFLKQKNAPSEEQLAKAEKRRQHEANLKQWSDTHEAYLKSLPRTWRGYVEHKRHPLIAPFSTEPFPDIPNPIPKDYPEPEGWKQEHVYYEFPPKDAQD